MPGKYTDRSIVEAAEIEAYQANLPDPTDLPATVFWLKDELRRIERASATMEVLLRAVSAELIAVADASPAAGVAIDDDTTGTDTTWSSDKIAAELSDVEGEANTTSNAGDGVGLALPKSDEDLPFKSIAAGAGVVLEDDGATVTVSAPSELDDTAVEYSTGWSSAKIKSAIALAIPAPAPGADGTQLTVPLTPDAARYGDLQKRLGDAEEDIAAIVVATADDPLLAYSALPTAARIEALKDEIARPTLFDLTPDAARYGSVTVQLATLEEGLADAVADIAAIAAGDPLLAYSALPDNARIAALSERIPDPLLALAISGDGAKIAALSQRMDNEAWQHFTPDAARYGELSVRVGGVEADVIDLAADVAAITAGDPILAYSTLPLLARVGAFDERITATESDIADLESDVAAITAGDPILAYSSLPDNARIGALSLRVDDIEAFPLPGMVDAARYGSLHERVTETESDVAVLAVAAAVLAADVVEIDHTLASLHPLHAKVADLSNRQESPLLYTPDAARFGYLNARVGAAEESIADVAADVAAVGDPLLAYSALPDKAAISALRDDVTAVDRAMVALQPLHAKLAADSTRLDAHEALNEAYFAYFEILLNLVADVANTQFMLAGPPLAGRVAALSEQVTATNILAFPGPDSARYAALVEQLKDEVQNLRVEIAALYSDRAKLAHLDNRVNDMELISWL